MLLKLERNKSKMSEKRKYKVGLVQMRMGPDPEANFASAVRHVREAARMGANVVCLPELFRAQYFCQREDLRLFDLAEAQRTNAPAIAECPRVQP